MTQFEIIKNCIVALENIEVKGYKNLKTLSNVVEALDSLAEKLHKEQGDSDG